MTTESTEPSRLSRPLKERCRRLVSSTSIERADEAWICSTSSQRSAVVGVGEVVDADWRVDAIEAGGQRLTDLPLGLAQFIPFAAAAA